jgi:hypothetical protein
MVWLEEYFTLLDSYNTGLRNLVCRWFKNEVIIIVREI